MKETREKIKIYKNKYRKSKKTDDLIDAITSLLGATSISLTITGMTFPPLLIASAICGGVAFIISRVQEKINFKRKCEQNNVTINQYSGLIREIITVLTKNNLSSQEYHNYINEIYDKISIIEDVSILI